MRASMAALAFALFAAVITLSDASTVGQTVYGYGPLTTDVTMYYNLTLDVIDIQAATNSSATNFAAVKDIYLKGKNALRSGSYVGTARTAKSIVENTYVGRPYYDLAATYYKDPTWLGNFLGSAVNGTKSPFIETAADYCCGSRVETVRGGYRAFLGFFALNYVDAAVNATNATVATRNLEEAVGIWYGNGSTTALFGAANSRARRGCTNNTMGSVANDDFFGGATALYDAIKGGNAMAAKAAARERMWTGVASLFLQAFIYNGNEAAVTPPGYLTITAPCITKCGIKKAKQAGGLIYWRLVAPILAKESPEDVAAVTAAFVPTAPTPEPAAWEALKKRVQAAADKAGMAWTSKVDACVPAPSAADSPLGASGRRLKRV